MSAAHGLAEAPADPSPEGTPRSKRGRSRVLTVVGAVLMVAGVVGLAVAVYQLWWTNILAERSFAAGRDELNRQWQSQPVPEEPRPIKTKPGKSFGLIYIPRLKHTTWGVPVLEGAEQEQLQQGFGHHPGTAVPGEPGNFAIAGHRITYGEPLGDIDKIQPGDKVIVETKNGWYTYELQRSEITVPTAGWILDPVPGRSRKTKPVQPLITMYSCNPRYSARERFVWFGKLIRQSAKSEGPPKIIRKTKV